MSNWKRRQINQRFQRNLRARFGRRQFTTGDAERVYREDHWEGSPRSSRRLPSAEEYCLKHGIVDPVVRRNVELNAAMRAPNQFTAMSARNSISAAVYYGELKRVRKGVYRF